MRPWVLPGGLITAYPPCLPIAPTQPTSDTTHLAFPPGSLSLGGLRHPDQICVETCTMCVCAFMCVHVASSELSSLLLLFSCCHFFQLCVYIYIYIYIYDYAKGLLPSSARSALLQGKSGLPHTFCLSCFVFPFLCF